MKRKRKTFDWAEEYPAAITVCDRQGTIIAMNRAAGENFQKYGGRGLVGSSLFACHSPASGRAIRRMLDQEQGSTYITDNGSRKRLVQQVPWYRDGRFAGLVETIIDLPAELPVRRRGQAARTTNR
ncbi:MAG TPA: diguanylate cyclase [Desulfobulbus sp.]|nr:diguanylate cyclase [Desulfobulbus sp.]